MKKTEIKAKWLHELRYGGHEQVPGTLKGIKSDGTIGFCCLGVLEEKVLGKELNVINLLDPDDPQHVQDYEGPAEVYVYLKNVVVGDQSLTGDFMQKNDDGWTFPEIADYIERIWNPDVDETVE